MRRLLEFFPVRWLGMAAWGLFVLLLTTLPGNVPLVKVLAEFIGGTDSSAMVGHVSLFAILTLLTWRALTQWFDARYAVLMAIVAALLIGTSTEVFQWFVSERNATLADLFSNWLGAFMIGFVVSVRLSLQK
jgi:hypothetical protein